MRVLCAGPQLMLARAPPGPRLTACPASYSLRL